MRSPLVNRRRAQRARSTCQPILHTLRDAFPAEGFICDHLRYLWWTRSDHCHGSANAACGAGHLCRCGWNGSHCDRNGSCRRRKACRWLWNAFRSLWQACHCVRNGSRCCWKWRCGRRQSGRSEKYPCACSGKACQAGGLLQRGRRKCSKFCHSARSDESSRIFLMPYLRSDDPSGFFAPLRMTTGETLFRRLLSRKRAVGMSEID